MEKIVNVTCKEKVKRHLKDNTVQVSLINLPVCQVISNSNWNYIYIYGIKNSQKVSLMLAEDNDMEVDLCGRKHTVKRNRKGSVSSW